MKHNIYIYIGRERYIYREREMEGWMDGYIWNRISWYKIKDLHQTLVVNIKRCNGPKILELKKIRRKNSM